MFVDFIAYYSEHVADRSLPFPGLIDALDMLAARGCRFAVCTNKLEACRFDCSANSELADRFVAICGQDTFGIQKPDPEILRRTIKAAGGRLATTVMIGDLITDIRTARAAGVPVIAVNFGYNERPIAEFGPDRIIGHFSELPALGRRRFRPHSERVPKYGKCGKVNGAQSVAPAWVRPYPCWGERAQVARVGRLI